MDKYAVGKQIRKARKEKRLSADALADKIGKSQSYIIMLENGQRRINFDIISLIANALEKPVAFFFASQDTDSKNSLENSLKEGLGITTGNIKELPENIKNAIRSLIEPYITNN